MTKRSVSLILTFAVIVVLAMVMAACSGAAQQTQAPTQGEKPTEAVQATATTAPTQASEATATTAPTEAAQPTEAAPAAVTVPQQEAWASSGHADAASMAFTDWNETEDKSVPVACAKCHSSTGFVDFIGGDGSEAGKVDKPAPIGTTIDCNACHNPAASALNTVTFPSGVTISNLGPEARCMTCHQGRESKASVDAQIEKFQATDADAVVAPIKEGDKQTNFGFRNIHYYAAAATLYGSQVKGGYEYDGKSYDVKFMHTEGYDTCVGCHDPHSLQVKIDQCAMCHEGVASVEDLHNIREKSSASDYDGDGNTEEGMYFEIQGLQEKLLAGLQSYAKDVAGTGIVYDAAAYPYWFADADGDGAPDKKDDANVSFSTWTPRLLKAAYNYQVSIKDPGQFAHGNKYIVQLLTDSIADLNEKLTTKIDMANAKREDSGHFAGDTMPFRDWDDTGMVPGTCAKCHSATGLPQFIKEGANISNPASNGFLCSTCHDEANWPNTYALKEVTFPSGAKVSFGEEAPANLCLACHQGRESTVSVNNAVKGLDPDTADPKIRFRNVHYFAGGATLFGTEVKGIYEYAGKTYSGRFMHVQNFDTCVACHDPHVLQAKTDACAGCHQTDDPKTIRMNTKGDFNGNGDDKEGLYAEMTGMQEKLYAGIQAYAKDVAGAGLLYSPDAYPYFFLDKDNDGQPDKDDKGATIAYNAWTPRLLQAAYNYQYSQKDPGAYVHNATYVMQALYDSMEDLKTKVPSIDMTGMVRPEPLPAPAQ